MNTPQRSLPSTRPLSLICCSPSTSLAEAAQTMIDEDVSCLVVVDAEGYLLGIISRTDFLPMHGSQSDWHNLPVANCMSRHVITVTQYATPAEVAQCLLSHAIHRVVVIDSRSPRTRPLGVIADSDLLRRLVEQW